MNEFLQVSAMNAGLVLTVMTALWGLSVALNDSSIADIFWGFGFVLIVFFTALISDGVEERRHLILALTTLWGLRLTAYLGWRNWGREDPRYKHLRQHIESKGGNYVMHSLVHIYWLQGLFMWIVSIVLVFSMTAAAPPQLGWLAWTGAALALFGVIFEAIADIQLSRFRGNPDNNNKILDQGLWKYTRHPNYFGESCVWTGFFLIALEIPWGLFTIVSVAMMFYALIGPTGKALLERRMAKKRPDFEDYKRRTSSFFPLPPKQ